MHTQTQSATMALVALIQSERPFKMGFVQESVTASAATAAAAQLND